MALFDFKVVTPNGKMYSGEAELITVITSCGVIGVMKNHTPLEAIIEISKLVIHKKDEIEEIAIGGGILHISKNSVIILADSFELKEEIDLERAKKAKARAEDRLSNGLNIDVKRAELALNKAINRINVVTK